MNKLTCLGNTQYQGMPNGKGIRVDIESTSPSLSLTLNSTHKNGYFASQFIANESKTQSTPNESYVVQVGVLTTITVNGVLFGTYNLIDNFNSFKTTFQNTYTGSVVTKNATTNVITINVNNTSQVYNNIVISHSSVSNTYSFTEVPCNVNKSSEMLLIRMIGKILFQQKKNLSCSKKV